MLGCAGQLTQIPPGIVEEAAKSLELTDSIAEQAAVASTKDAAAGNTSPNSSVDVFIEAMKQFRTGTPLDSSVNAKNEPAVSSNEDARSEIRVLRSVVDVLIDAMRQNLAAARE
jgi:hypothetical protein